ncbi:MAG: tRNA (adenosine(37)-N6)-threonylcarbamoyltransferase complex ATPase subunit type 1 TsaE [Acidimicrobiales bacterium]
MSAPHIEARTSSPDETRALAAAFSAVLRPGDVVLLAGDLGAGKTTFAQGVAVGLGVVEQVTSPTFTLVRPYACGSDTARRGDVSARATDASSPGCVRTMLHADLYRLDHMQEVVDLAIDEMVEDAAVAVIEWGDVAEPVLGGDAIVLRLTQGASSGDARVVTVELHGRSAGLDRELRSRLAPWAPGS